MQHPSTAQPSLTHLRCSHGTKREHRQSTLLASGPHGSSPDAAAAAAEQGAVSDGLMEEHGGEDEELCDHT